MQWRLQWLWRWLFPRLGWRRSPRLVNLRPVRSLELVRRSAVPPVGRGGAKKFRRLCVSSELCLLFSGNSGCSLRRDSVGICCLLHRLHFRHNAAVGYGWCWSENSLEIISPHRFSLISCSDLVLHGEIPVTSAFFGGISRLGFVNYFIGFTLNTKPVFETITLVGKQQRN